jgi:CheY-like chemotaxis protein
MTAYPTEQVRGEALRYGSVQYLEKPFNFSQLVNAIRDGLYQPRGRGVSGAVSLETLPDLVQLLAQSNITGALEMNYVGQRGAIWFDRGAIIHAHTATHVGEEAFFEIMGWRGGEFSMERNALPPDRTIFENATGLIMEALRREDEEERDRIEQGPPPVSRSLFPTPPEVSIGSPNQPLAFLAATDGGSTDGGTSPQERGAAVGVVLSGSLRERARTFLTEAWEAVEALVSELGPRGLSVVVDLPTGAWAALDVGGLSSVIHEPSEPEEEAVDDHMHLRIAMDASELARAARALTLGEDGCMEKISGTSGVAILWRSDLQCLASAGIVVRQAKPG